MKNGMWVKHEEGLHAKAARHQLHIARKIGIIKPIYGQWNKAKIRGKAGNGVWFGA